MGSTYITLCIAQDGSLLNKLFVQRSFEACEIKSSVSANLDPGKGSVHCAAVCVNQGPENCQGFQNDHTSAVDGCKLITFQPWAKAGDDGDILVHTILDYLGSKH